MDDNSNKLEGKLVESIKIGDLGDLAQKYTELGLDLVVEDGILKDIPIVGTIAKSLKAVGNIRDRWYLRKLLPFLQKVGETNQQQREKFIEDNCQDVRQFEEAVLLILEQADNMEKPSLIGKIFKACILGKIRYGDAIILSEMVNRALWGDLEAMLNVGEDKHQKQRLFLSGLFEMDDNINWKEIGKLKVKRNDYALALQEIYRENYDNLDKYLLEILAKSNDTK